jgi:hypothetical protein
VNHPALMRLIQLLLIALSCAACLERADTEPPGYSSFVVPPGGEVRTLERTMAAKMKLDLNDGLTSPVPLRTGYAGGQEVQYWDLGQAPTSAEPMWIIARSNGSSSQYITTHPPVIESIPGETAYSPIRLLFDVFVTDRYSGEHFPSLRAIEDGVELGLLEPPKANDLFTNCVVTLQATEFEFPPDVEPRPTTAAYYKDRIVYQFCVGDLMSGSGTFAARMGAPVFGNAFLLRRENEVPTLDESVFKADLNSDGDQLDSNVVFDSVPGDSGYTSLWKNLDVVVTAGYPFGDLTSQDALFDKKSWGLESKDERVVEYKDTGLIVNRPIYQPRSP